LEVEREREREWQFNRADGSEFQVRGTVVLKDRLANDVKLCYRSQTNRKIIIKDRQKTIYSSQKELNTKSYY